jgi:hypothetical protein
MPDSVRAKIARIEFSLTDSALARFDLAASTGLMFLSDPMAPIVAEASYAPAPADGGTLGGYETKSQTLKVAEELATRIDFDLSLTASLEALLAPS